MAQSPRKSSASRKPVAPDPAADLFNATAGEEASQPVKDEQWNLDEGTASLPKVGSVPRASPVRVTPITQPVSGSFESNPRSAAESIPEALAAKPASPAPQPVAEPHDPFKIEDDLPPVSADRFPTSPDNDPLPATPRVLPGEIVSLEQTDPLSRPRPQANWSRTGLWVAITLLGGVLALFFGILYVNRPDGEIRNARPLPTVPLVGRVAVLSAINSGWRTRQSRDLVSMVDIVLPSPSRQPPDLVPEVRITIDPAASRGGFLRFIFLDPDGKISGDVRVVKVSGAVLEPLSSGAHITVPGSAAIYGSLGFMDRPAYVAYATGSSSRWSVEVSESADYNAREEGWTKLDTFDIRNAGEP